MEWAGIIDSAVHHIFKVMRECPTFNEAYEITVDDTSVIKRVNIYCPLDSLEIENSKRDFVRYYLGHLRLENHGNIEAGEKSWVGQ